MLFQREAGVIGSQCDAHSRRLYYVQAAPMPSVTLSPRGEQRLSTGHPWIYRADVIDVTAQGGDIVTVRGARGRTVGHAFYSSQSQIALRMLTYGEEPADAALIRKRIESAI